MQIGNAMSNHQGSFKTHSESKATKFIGIYATGFEHLRIYHSTTAPLDPAAIEENIDFGAWLGEWEE